MCDLALEPEITEILMHSRDPEELKYIWVEWRKASGEQVKCLYPKYVELANTAASLNNFSDYAAYWMKDYEADDFPEQIGKHNIICVYDEALVKRTGNLRRNPLATIETAVSAAARLRSARTQEEIRREYRFQGRPDSSTFVRQHLGSDMGEHRGIHCTISGQAVAGR